MLCNPSGTWFERTDRTYSLQSKANGPVRPGNLAGEGGGSAWVKITMSFTSLKAASASAPHCTQTRKWIHSPVYYWIQPPACLTGSLTRTYEKLHRSSNSPAYSDIWTGARSVAFPICKAKLGASPDQGIHCTLLLDLGPQTTSYIGPGTCPAALPGQGS